MVGGSTAVGPDDGGLLSHLETDPVTSFPTQGAVSDSFTKHGQDSTLGSTVALWALCGPWG